MERLKKENARKREEREAELLKQADQLSQAAAAVRKAEKDGKCYTNNQMRGHVEPKK